MGKGTSYSRHVVLGFFSLSRFAFLVKTDLEDKIFAFGAKRKLSLSTQGKIAPSITWLSVAVLNVLTNNINASACACSSVSRVNMIIVTKLPFK